MHLMAAGDSSRPLLIPRLSLTLSLAGLPPEGGALGVHRADPAYAGFRDSRALRWALWQVVSLMTAAALRQYRDQARIGLLPSRADAALLSGGSTALVMGCSSLGFCRIFLSHPSSRGYHRLGCDHCGQAKIKHLWAIVCLGRQLAER